MTNDDKDLKLKECPFCGNKIIVVTKSDCFYFKITCVYCLTTMTSKNPYKAWNTRATPQQPNKCGDETHVWVPCHPSIGEFVCGKCAQIKGKPQQPSEPLKELDEETIRREVKYQIDLAIEHFLRGHPYNLSEPALNFINERVENILSVAKFGQPSEQKYKAEAIYEAIKKSDVGDDIVIHNEDMSVWCILNLVTREHPERESNGKDRS